MARQQDEIDAATDTNRGTDASTGLTHEQRAVEFLRRAMRLATHWRPSMAMAKCLGLPPTKIQLTNDKNDTTNLVWTTVLVLLFCASQLADLHEIWYEMADAAIVWLYQQPHFVEHREDLVTSACALLHVRDVTTTLTNIFSEPKDDEARALEAALGDWKLCYLDEPPYTAYYWNEKTNLSTWRNPIETAQLEKARLEEKKRREEILTKVLPMRVKINRDRKPPSVVFDCDKCLTNANASVRRPATVCCVVCENKYFCDECCDLTHSTRENLQHISTGFRYIQCHGIKGFPERDKSAQ